MTFSGSGTFTQTGGTTNVAGSDTVSFGGVVAINGGTFILGEARDGANLDAPAGLQVGSCGTLVASGLIYGDVTDSGSVDDYDAPLTVTGNYTQVADGVTFVAGNGLTVTGLLEEQGGTFTIAGGVVTTGGNWLIDAGAKLVGNGTMTLNSNLTNAGLIDIEGGSGPGPIPGGIAVNGNFVQTAGGELDLHVYDASDYDAVAVSDTAVLDGTLRVIRRGYSPRSTDALFVLWYQFRSGAFSAVVDETGQAVYGWVYDVQPDPNSPMKALMLYPAS